VTDTYLRALAGAIPSVDVPRALAERGSPEVQSQIDQARALALRLHLQGTPAFLLSRTGTPPQRFSPASLDPGSFSGPLDKLLGP
jgi:hypothetical protein